MKKLLLFILFLSFTNCATKKKTVDKSRAETEYKESTGLSSTHTGKLNIESNFKGFGVEDFTHSLSWLNWQYADDFSVEIKQVDGGYKIEAKGKGEATGGQTISQEVKEWQSEYELKYSQLEKEFSDYKYETDQKLKVHTKEKEVEKESTGFQVGFWIFLGVAVLLSIVILYWVKPLS